MTMTTANETQPTADALRVDLPPPCSQCAEWRQLADDAINTLQITRKKYGIGDRHVMREKNLEIEKLTEVIRAATVLIAAKGRHNTMLAYEGLCAALSPENADVEPPRERKANVQ